MGKVFAGRYELLDPIADGGMGSVWVVRDLQEGDVKAAKVLRQQDAVSLLRFIREQATRIHHPHVVTPLGWAGADDDVLFTMPLMRGGSVATLLGDFGPLPERWVAELLTQTLTGLTAVHEAGVVHRDIKPGNLLLDHTGTARPHLRISDFGVAVPTDQPRLTAPMLALGTPGYLAPEQANGADPDPRQDIYAVGVTGLHLLTGDGPVRDPAAAPYDVTALPDTPLVALLRRAVDPDPRNRPQTAEALVTLLHDVLPPGPWDPGEVEVFDHWDSGGLDAVKTPALPRADLGETAVGADASATDHRGAAKAPWWPVALLALAGVALLVTGFVLLG